MSNKGIEISKHKVILFIILALTAAVFVVINYFPGIIDRFSSGAPSASPYFDDGNLTPDIFYTPASDLAAGGNFIFKYPMEFSLAKDELRDIGGEKRHVVILGWRSGDTISEDGKLMEGFDTERRIEINLDDCGRYLKCKNVDGVAIGTNSKDKRVQEAIGVIAKTFEILRPPPPPPESLPAPASGTPPNF